MSTLKVNNIQNANGTSAIAIDSSGVATFSKTLVPSSSMMYRNLIINGDMRIAQRGTNATGVTNNYATCDRFFIRNNNLGAFTITQDTNAPDGFRNSLKWDCTTADASPAAGDFANLQHRIEAQNLQHLAFGTSDAKQFTISFWVKSSETGNAVLRATNIDGSVSQGHLYTISSANTWEYKTITFTADTSNSFDNNNGIGLTLYWYSGVGSDRTSGTLRTTTWESSTVIADEAVGQTINIAATVGSYINITGVQLEVGDAATPFEHRPYDAELARCQRYFWKYPGIQDLCNAHLVSTTGAQGVFKFPQTMRTSPTITTEAVTDVRVSWSAGVSISSGFNIDRNSPTACIIRVTTTSLTTGQGGFMFVDGGSMSGSAEL